MSYEAVHVAVGVVSNAAKRVLLALRPSDVHQGGLWEFPGGKVRSDEDVRSALHRELAEEVGVIVDQARPLIKIRHEYPEQSVTLDVWCVDAWHGEVIGREGQRVEWVARNELCKRTFPLANLPIITAVKLPSLYLISPEPGADWDDFLGRIDVCLCAGVRLFQLRSKRLLAKRYRTLAREVRRVCRARGAVLLLNASPTDAVVCGADGVHLSSARLLQLNERPLGRDHWVAASCHHLKEIEHAGRIGVDFITVSPVYETSSHPDARPLGWEGFRKLADRTGMPVYALGGMQPAHIETAWRAGAQGLGMVSAIWDAPDPSRRICECLSDTSA